MIQKLKQLLFGMPRDLQDPRLFHRVSLVAFLAWVGLGADGLSSSAYGPDEAFRALGTHTHLAPILILMTAATIFVISIAYSNLIQHFPGGGGGYLVATKLLGEKAGVVSGCALLVDYVLTISVSVASACDAMWSFLPADWLPWKLTAQMVLLVILLGLNLRGVKESVTILAPIFLLFVVTHAFMIFYAIGSHVTQLPVVFQEAAIDFRAATASLGIWPVALILLKAYSMGGGTYTGIEAVSNGVSMFREPRVQTGKRTMFLMATSLAFTAGGILLGYLLTSAVPVAGKTLNAVLLDNLFGNWVWGGWSVGTTFVIVALISEAALLVVAAQAGFLDGPRVMGNMALDSWVPHRFSQLSERLVIQSGVFLMGIAAAATLLYSGGNLTTLVVMYSINVFLTFTLTELGMAKHWIVERHNEPKWKSQLAIHGTGLVMCLCILLVTLYEKFSQGGWVTACITLTTIALCFLIRSHYRGVRAQLSRLDDILLQPMTGSAMLNQAPLDPQANTAVLAVSGFNGFGIHQALSIQRLLPGYFKNFVFVSIGVLDSGNFKGNEEIARLEEKTREDLEKYVRWARQQGLVAGYRMTLDTEAVKGVEALCRALAQEFPKMIVFSGKLMFGREQWFQRLLHNETAYSLQRRLQFAGIQAMVLPIRV